jgi:hypothetical protein
MSHAVFLRRAANGFAEDARLASDRLATMPRDARWAKARRVTSHLVAQGFALSRFYRAEAQRAERAEIAERLRSALAQRQTIAAARPAAAQ